MLLTQCWACSWQSWTPCEEAEEKGALFPPVPGWHRQPEKPCVAQPELSVHTEQP